jgi:hypothetical protein
MLQALLLKERLKLRRSWWVPFLALAGALANVFLTWRSIGAMHGAPALWHILIYRQDVHFGALQWLLPFGGAWFACAQALPECSGRRLRLLFHLPVNHRLSLYVLAACGLALCLALLGAALGGFWLVARLTGFPPELIRAMAGTLLPWGLAGMTTWCATAAAVADPSFKRKLGFGMAGFGYMTLLTAGFGFSPMGGSLWLYAAVCLPWPLALEAAALRVKEGE